MAFPVAVTEVPLLTCKLGQGPGSDTDTSQHPVNRAGQARLPGLFVYRLALTVYLFPVGTCPRSGQRSVKIVYGVKISLSLGSQLGLLIPDWR